MAKQKETDLVKIEGAKGLKAFANKDSFEFAQRVAVMLSKSDLVPKEFKGNIGNCTIALNMANRMGADPLMVMQHLYIVHGKPSWSSTFLIAAINGSGKFKAPLRFTVTGEGQTLTCIAWTLDLTGERLESPAITMAMAKAEMWLDKAGSKWKTMPDLMIRYRAAAFFSRLYCPEITMGMQTVEEIQDAFVLDSKIELQPEDVNLEKERIRILQQIEKCKTIDELELLEGNDLSEFNVNDQIEAKRKELTDPKGREWKQTKIDMP